MSPSARPFGNDILPSLVVGRESERDTGKGSPEINPHNQLRFTPTSAFDFDGGVSGAILLGHPWGDSMGGGRLHAVAGRGTHGLAGGGILHVGVKGGIMMMTGQLLAGRERTRRTAVGVTRRAAQDVLIHG